MPVVKRKFAQLNLYTLHGVWERPPANNLPQTPRSAGAYGTGYVLLAENGWPGQNQIGGFGEFFQINLCHR